MKYKTLIDILISLYLINSALCQNNNLAYVPLVDDADDQKCDNNSMKIAMAVNTLGYYGGQDTARKAGMQMWRDKFKEICIDGTHVSGSSSCTVKKDICLEVVDIQGATDTTTVLNNLKTWVTDLLAVDSKDRARFIVTPLGDDEIQTVIDADSSKSSGAVNSKGTIPIIAANSGDFTPSSSSSTASTSYYTITPFPDYKTGLFYGIKEALQKRYHASSIVILGDTRTSSKIQNAGKLLLESLADQNVLLKRCTKYVSDLNPPSKDQSGVCDSKSDCDEDECLYPKVDLSSENENVNFESASKWIKYIKSLNPDVVILASDAYGTNFMKIMQMEEFTPKAAFGIQYDDVVSKPLNSGQDPSNWHFMATFIPNMGYGVKGRYFGTSEEVGKYIDQNFAKYVDPMHYPQGMERLDGNYRYFAEGIITGMTLQRVLEAKFSSLQDDVDTRQFAPQMIEGKKMLSVCNDETPNSDNLNLCTDGCNCKPWNTFFGPISFDGYNNEAVKGMAVQVHYSAEHKNVTSRIVAPASVPVCNDGVYIPDESKLTCKADSSFSGCTCSATYPVSWNYVREINDNYVASSSAAGVIFILFGIIQIIVEFVFIFNLIRKNKYWDTVCAPYVTMLYPLLSIMLSIYGMVQTGQHTSSLCTARNYFEYFVVYFAFLLLILSTTEEIVRMKRQEPSKSFYRVEILTYSICMFFVALIGCVTHTTDAVTTIDLTRGIRPYYDTVCEAHDEMYVFKVELACGIAIVGFVAYALRNSASFFFRGLQYYFLGVTFFFCVFEIVFQAVGKGDKIYYIMVWVYSWILSWLYMLPFMRPHKLMEDRKISQILLKPRYVKNKMRELLDNKLESHIFAVFLSSKENYSQYIDLYLDIEKHKNISDAAQLREDEKAIFATYLSGSAKELEILDSNMTSKINTEMGKGNSNAFNELQTAIVNHFITKNLYEEFLNSDYYWLIHETQDIMKGFRRHAIKTLETILEDIIVSIVIQETDPAALKQHVAFYNNSLQTRTTRTGSSYSKRDDKNRPSDIHQSHIGGVDVAQKDTKNSFNDSTLFSSEVNNVSEKLDSERDAVKRSNISASKNNNESEDNSSISNRTSSTKPENEESEKSKTTSTESKDKSKEDKSDEKKEEKKDDTKPAAAAAKPATTTPAAGGAAKPATPKAAAPPTKLATPKAAAK